MSASIKFNQATGNNVSILPVHIFRGLGFQELDAPNLNINHTFDCKNAGFHYSGFCICPVCTIIGFAAF